MDAVVLYEELDVEILWIPNQVWNLRDYVHLRGTSCLNVLVFWLK